MRNNQQSTFTSLYCLAKPLNLAKMLGHTPRLFGYTPILPKASAVLPLGTERLIF
jgi:hypothetical protein